MFYFTAVKACKVWLINSGERFKVRIEFLCENLLQCSEAYNVLKFNFDPISAFKCDVRGH